MATTFVILLALLQLFTAEGLTRQIELKEGSIPFFDIKIAYKLYDIVNPGPEEGPLGDIAVRRWVCTQPS